MFLHQQQERERTFELLLFHELSKSSYPAIGPSNTTQYTPPTAQLTTLLIYTYTPCCQMQCLFVLCGCLRVFPCKIQCWGKKQPALCILPHTLDLMGHTRSCTHSAFSLSIHPSHMYVDCICTNACNTEDVSHLPGLRSWLIISSLNSPVR